MKNLVLSIAAILLIAFSLLVSTVQAQTAPPVTYPETSGTPKVGDIVPPTGTVDIFDYNQLLTEFGKTDTGLLGDIDKNNKVDIFDYNLLLTNFGK